MIAQKLGPFFYWYIPRAIPPSIDFGKALFVRFDPPQEGDDFQMKNVCLAPHDIQPSTTLMLDLIKTEATLQTEMHGKCRYNIKVAEREKVEVRITDEKEIGIFLELLAETTKRDAFRGHPAFYYRTLLQETPDPDLHIFLAIASVQGKPAAAAIMCDYHGTRTYLHGASAYALRDKMAPYGLHWFLIQDAKKKGLTAYDFWGITPEGSGLIKSQPAHPLAGVTRFKKGWGGEVVHYPKTYDLILRPFFYRMYRLLYRFLRP